MMIYLSCFFISVMLFRISEIKRLTKFRGVLIAIAIILPCVVAGMRSNEVGTDTAGYPMRLFLIAERTEFFQYQWSTFLHGWDYEYVYSMGVGYSTFIYIVANLFHDFRMVLFCTELLIVFCVYKAVKIFRKNENVWIGMLVFFLLFYNVTLNMMRQWMAMAMLLLSFVYLVSNKKRLTILFAVLAVLFHKTAVCGFVVHLIYVMLERRSVSEEDTFNRIKYKRIVSIFICAVLIVLVFEMDTIRYLIDLVGFSEYSAYFAGQVSFSVGRFLVDLPAILLLIFNWKKVREKKCAYFYLTFVVINIILSQLNSLNDYAWRIGSYFSCFLIIVFPELVSVGPKWKAKVGKSGLILYGLIYWFYYFNYLNIHQTIPFVFR